MNAYRDAEEIFASNYGGIYRTHDGIAVSVSCTDRGKLECFAAIMGVGYVRGPYERRSCPVFPCHCTFGTTFEGTDCPRPDWYSYATYSLDAVIQVASQLWEWLSDEQRFRFEFAIDDCIRERLRRYRGRQSVRARRARAANKTWKRFRYELAAGGASSVSEFTEHCSHGCRIVDHYGDRSYCINSWPYRECTNGCPLTGCGRIERPYLRVALREQERHKERGA